MDISTRTHTVIRIYFQFKQGSRRDFASTESRASTLFLVIRSLCHEFCMTHILKLFVKVPFAVALDDALKQ